MTDDKPMFTYSILIYSVGIFMSILYFGWLYTIYSKHSSILYTVTFFVISILGMNGYFSYLAPIESFQAEIEQYSYVEQNARVLLTSSLAVAVFFKFSSMQKKMSSNVKKGIEIPIIMSFVFSCLIITLIWMPQSNGIYIRILRDVKTIFLTLSIASVIVSMCNALPLIIWGTFHNVPNHCSIGPPCVWCWGRAVWRKADSASCKSGIFGRWFQGDRMLDWIPCDLLLLVVWI